MRPALDVKQMQKEAKKLYSGEQRIVGIILARYNMTLVKTIVDSEYFYWHHNSSKYFDIFWAGYGENKFSDFKATQTQLECKENDTGVFFDLEAFINCKRKLASIKGFHYNDEPVLVLVQYDRDRIKFEEFIRIDLEKNLDEGNRFIRNIMEFLTNECAAKSSVEELSKSLKKRTFFETIKGVEASDVISTILGIAGLVI